MWKSWVFNKTTQRVTECLIKRALPEIKVYFFLFFFFFIRYNCQLNNYNFIAYPWSGDKDCQLLCYLLCHLEYYQGGLVPFKSPALALVVNLANTPISALFMINVQFYICYFNVHLVTNSFHCIPKFVFISKCLINYMPLKYLLSISDWLNKPFQLTLNINN